MKSTGTWLSKPKTINLICNIITPENLIDATDFTPQSGNITNCTKQGSWLAFDYILRNALFRVFVYRKKIIIQSNKLTLPSLQDSKEQPLERIIKIALHIQDIKKEVAIAVTREVYPGINFELKAHLVVICDSIKRQKINNELSGWIDDGMTTFFTRVYDSYSSSFGYFRVSRHLSMSFNISDQLNQDFINIIYENFLYKDAIVKEDVFEIFDSLSRYVLPTEVNLYIQKIFYFLAIFAVASSVFISLISEFSNSFLPSNYSILLLLLKYAIIIGGLFLIWVIISRLIKQTFRF